MSDDEKNDPSIIKSFRALDDLETTKSSRPLENKPLETKPIYVGPDTVVVPGPPKETAKDKDGK
jgi:hypothetical protein